MYPFLYKLEIINELADISDRDYILHPCGITYGATYAEAMERLVDWYGDKNIVKVKFLFALENEPIELSETILATIAANA